MPKVDEPKSRLIVSISEREKFIEYFSNLENGVNLSYFNEELWKRISQLHKLLFNTDIG